MSSPNEQPASSPLLDWVKSQPMWVHHVVRGALDGHITTNNLRTEEYLELCLREGGLAEGELPDAPALADLTPPSSAPAVAGLVLLTMEILRGVNRLKDGSRIDFAPGLTVIFGENGAGKSGFVRVLKRCAGARTHTRVLGDVANATNPAPSAKFTYEMAGSSGDITWNDELGIAPLTALSIFDSPSSRVHVDDDLSYSYVPEALSTYRTVRDVIDNVKNRLTERADARPVPDDRFATQFQPGTAVHQLTAKLNGAVNLAALQELASVSNTDKERLSRLLAETSALRSRDVDTETQLARARSAALGKVMACLTVVSKIDYEMFNDVLDVRTSARAAERVAVGATIANPEIAASASPEWQAFIEAGYAYDVVASNAGHDPSSTCSYCRRPLDHAAAALLRTYADFVAGHARLKKDMAEEAVTAFARIASGLKVAEAREAVAEVIGESDDHPWRRFEKGLELCGKVKDAMIAEQRLDALERLPESEVVFVYTEKQMLDERVRNLGAEASTKAEMLSTLEAELRELQDRVTLEAKLSEIRDAVGALRWNEKAAAIVRDLVVSQRSLTEASNSHTRQLINSNFEAAFADECSMLEAPGSVVLQFPGREGQTLRKKAVAGNRPSDVLSEGEQKAIAMADFIAEATVSRPGSPLVFDDPVTSLDYRRLEAVAARLRDLSDHRQVVVFTHDVWFASVLLDPDGLNKDRVRYWDVAQTEEGVGVVTPASHPNIDSYKNLRRRLLETIDSASKATGNDQLENVKKGYGLIRSLTEVVVEKDLFRGVCQRYQAHVMMTGLSDIKVGSLPDSIRKIFEVYKRACRITDAHSQPHQQSNVPPSLQGLRADWATIEQIHALHTAA